jgi:ATP-dependent helicase Lhr and Lhr-like helicase
MDRVTKPRTKRAKTAAAPKPAVALAMDAAPATAASPARHPIMPPARPPLPPAFEAWFAGRGWSPRAHQLALLDKARERRSTLLIAPTGAGKTLAGFLPSLVELTERPKLRDGSRLHTLYISPLKALATDVARNLVAPVTEMALDIRIETRTGDTPVSKRQRQRVNPPDILMTTPEQIALLLSHEDAGYLFGGLRTIVLDELHALAASKRGDLLALDLARLRTLVPDVTIVGLSATVARPSELRAYLVGQDLESNTVALADLVQINGGAEPHLTILETDEPLPWASHTTRYAMPQVYEILKRTKLALLFVNTRSQAELVFQELWRLNDDSLPIALHHGSLDVGQRRKVEAAMADGRLRAVVATSTLDLGIDWGDIDLVINIGAPKGASRLIQRIGRANHRLDEPSRGVLVPSNRFEVLECRAALEAAAAGAQDASHTRSGALDVLAQHVWGMACAGPFHASDLYNEVRSAAPYAWLPRQTFDRILDFVSTGGYALRTYERYARLRAMDDGRLRLSHPRLANQYRMNVGTIVEAPMIKVRLAGRRGAPSGGARKAFAGGRVLGELEEWFIEQLAPGDTFVFAGEVLRFEALIDTDAFVSRAANREPKIPTYQGGKFPLSTHLAARVRAMIAAPDRGARLPLPVAEWLDLQAKYSVIPSPAEMLVETFPRAEKHFLVAYPFEGRLVHQTLGVLLTKRLERLGGKPLGFVASDYALAIWGLGDLSGLVAQGRLQMSDLFDEDMLGDDLDAWLAESSLMKRTFRYCAVIAGLIERRHPGKVKSGRQVTVSSDLIYDVLRRHEPNHILLEAAWADAASGLLDIARLADFLKRIKGRGHIRHVALDRASPLSVPVLIEMGRESVYGGSAREDLLRAAADELIREATQR